MRLQPKRAPDLLHGRTAQPARFRHVAAAPMRLPAGRLLQRPHDRLLNLLVADLPRRTRAARCTTRRAARARIGRTICTPSSATSAAASRPLCLARRYSLVEGWIYGAGTADTR